MDKSLLSPELVTALSGRREPWLERLLRKVEAVNGRYALFGPDDPMLVGLSGGKDSLALLTLLAILGRSRGPVYACLVENEGLPIPPEARSRLSDFCAALGLPFSVRSIAIDGALGCFSCAKARRRALAEEAKSLQVSRIALGHTMTDAARTALMNLARNGRLEGLEPVRWYFDGAFAIIRPLLFCSESDVQRIVRRLSLPVQPSPCPLAGATARAEAVIALEHLVRIDRDAALHIADAALRHEHGHEPVSEAGRAQVDRQASRY